MILPQVLITDVEIQQRETIKQIIEKGWRHRKELLFPGSLAAGYVIDIKIKIQINKGEVSKVLQLSQRVKYNKYIYIIFKTSI